MKREHGFWLVLIIGNFLLFITIVEIAVRMFVDDGMHFDLEMWKYARDLKQIANNPLIGHIHRPNSQARLMGVDVKINSHGLREREIPYERTASVLRVLMLGDSFTEGWGVRVEETFSKRIERLYAANGINAEVINAGVGNYNTIMEVESFLEEGYRYHPDIVVLNYFVNDAEPVPPHRAVNFLSRTCYSYVFVTGRIDTLMRRFSVRPDWSNYYLKLYDDGNSKGWLEAKASIGKLADYCKLHNVKLLIALIPELHDLQHYRFGKVDDLLRRTTEEKGIEFVDLLPVLKSEEPAKLWVTPSDLHPNSRAHDLIAGALYRKIEAIR